jgi:hypothetical protein
MSLKPGSIVMYEADASDAGTFLTAGLVISSVDLSGLLTDTRRLCKIFHAFPALVYQPSPSAQRE